MSAKPCPECRTRGATHKLDCSRRPAVRSFGACDNPKCVLERHTIAAGNVWHQDINRRAWVTFHVAE